MGLGTRDTRGLRGRGLRAFVPSDVTTGSHGLPEDEGEKAVKNEIAKYDHGGCYAVLVDLASKKPPTKVMTTLFLNFIIPVCIQYFLLLQLKAFAWGPSGGLCLFQL